MNEEHETEPEVILVDASDRPIGTAARLEAHQGEGRLHRAFSIFIFNVRGDLLLQRRSANKPLFARLWTNACCSRPRWGEDTAAAAHRRLREEFGFSTELREVFAFEYVAFDAESGLTEREFDHVFVGEFSGAPDPDSFEIADWKWVSPEDLTRDVEVCPEEFSPWFRVALEKGVLSYRPRALTTNI